jgi:hypothetical protein
MFPIENHHFFRRFFRHCAIESSTHRLIEFPWARGFRVASDSEPVKKHGKTIGKPWENGDFHENL